MGYIAIIAAIFFGDMLLKDYMEKSLLPDEERKALKGMVLLRKHHNKGAFLNIGEKKRKGVALLSLLLTIMLTIWFCITLGTKGQVFLKTGLSLLLGGAYSNTYDRLKRKYVMDYVSFPVKWNWLSRMIFNVSDFCIILGAFAATLQSVKQ